MAFFGESQDILAALAEIIRVERGKAFKGGRSLCGSDVFFRCRGCRGCLCCCCLRLSLKLSCFSDDYLFLHEGFGPDLADDIQIFRGLICDFWVVAVFGDLQQFNGKFTVERGAVITA